MEAWQIMMEPSRPTRRRTPGHGTTAVLVLAVIAVPLFTNLASASLPQSWQPYLGYSWLLLLVCAVPVVVQEVRRRRREDQAFADTDLAALVGATPPPAPHFTGRDEEADRIRAGVLKQRQVTVQGLPGVGKTQAVAYYTRKYAAEYDFVWWVRAQNPVTLSADLAAIASAKALAGGRTAVLEWLRTNDRWLIVFDNATADSDIQRFVPALPTGHVIIVSRERLAVTTAVEKIGDWTPREADDFLAQVLPAPAETRRQLASALHFVPLALAQAANYIQLAQLTPESYLELLTKRAREMFAATAGPDRENTIAAGYSLAISAANREARGAKQLVQLCSLYADGPIPRHLPSAFGQVRFKTVLGLKSPVSQTFRRKLADPLAYNAWVGALTRHLILTAEGDAFRMHPLVAQTVRVSLGKSRTRKLAYYAATALTEICFREDLWRSPGTPEVWKPLLPHIMSLGELALTIKPPLTSWNNFEVRVAWYCWRDISLLLGLASIRLASQDEPAEGERVAHLALELAKRAYAPTPVFRGAGAPYSWVPLANALEACANYAAAADNFTEAERLFRLGLRVTDARIGALHRTGMVTGLAAVLEAQGKRKAARKLLEKESPALRKHLPAGTREGELLDEMLEHL
jgi:hypothetical protein